MDLCGVTQSSSLLMPHLGCYYEDLLRTCGLKAPQMEWLQEPPWTLNCSAGILEAGGTHDRDQTTQSRHRVECDLHVSTGGNSDEAGERKWPSRLMRSRL